MNRENLTSDLLLLTAAGIWGFAFVAQRIGMEVFGPFLFNGIRFILGSLLLLALRPFLPEKTTEKSGPTRRQSAGWGLLAGFVLFAGASLQQVGIMHTTAGKAGFITGLYVVLVPFLGLIQRQKIHSGAWLGVLLVGIGLYFLSINEDFTIAPGDFLVLLGAFFWAIHVQLIGYLAPRLKVIDLALMQNFACAGISLLVAVFFETIKINTLQQGILPLFYAGFFSIGIAYTLQIVGMKKAPPTHAAIILSFEAVFAAIGGWLLLREQLPWRSLLGCSLMFLGMLASQFRLNFFAGKNTAIEKQPATT